MLAVRLPDNLESKLNNLAEKTGRPKSYYVRLALEDFLQAQEEYLLALSRLEKKGSRISLEVLEKKLDDMDD